MTEADWSDGSLKSVMVFLNGCAIPGGAPRGERVVDDSFMLLFNGGTEPALFTLPGDPWAKEYELVADTGLAYVRPHGADAPSYMAGEELSMTSRSLAGLRRRA